MDDILCPIAYPISCAAVERAAGFARAFAAAILEPPLILFPKWTRERYDRDNATTAGAPISARTLSPRDTARGGIWGRSMRWRSSHAPNTCTPFDSNRRSSCYTSIFPTNFRSTSYVLSTNLAATTYSRRDKRDHDRLVSPGFPSATLRNVAHSPKFRPQISEILPYVIIWSLCSDVIISAVRRIVKLTAW